MTATAGPVIALVPAKNNEGSVGATVRSLRSAEQVSDVVVIDDGSTDATTAAAHSAGAVVVRMDVNCGKGAALAVGLRARPGAHVYLLVDADTGESARAATGLLGPVLSDEADLVIGTLPAAAGRGGLGTVKRVAATSIEHLCGFRAEAPLSGQRAVRGELLRGLVLQPRFGVEVAMTVDAVRQGQRVVEQPVAMDHDHRGRSLRGFAHRARQGGDVLVASAQRLLGLRVRVALAVVGLLACLAALAASSASSASAFQPLVTNGEVSVVVVPGATWADVGDLVPSHAGSIASPLNAEQRPLAAFPASSTLVPGPAALKRGTVIVVGEGAPGDKVLRPVLVFNADGGGPLTSPATQTPGMVAAEDLAGDLMVATGPLDLEAQQANVDLVSFYDQYQPIIITALVGALVIMYAAALLLGRSHHRLPGAEMVARLIVAFPLATYLVRALGPAATVNIWVWSALLALTVGIISVVAGRAGGTVRAGEEVLDRTGPLRRVLLATVGLILLDLVWNGTLQTSGIFGSSPSLGSRYYGLGNPATTILLTTLVLWMALHVRASRQRRAAWFEASALFVLSAAMVALPSFGADSGGALAFGLTGALLLPALWFGRVHWKYLGVGAFGSLLMVSALAAIDGARATAQQTHLGRLYADVLQSGPAPLFDVLVRRADANLFGYGFPWTLVVLVAVIGLVVALFRSSLWRSFLGRRSFARLAAAIGGFAALALFATNDSGIVVLALTAVAVGPLLLVESESRFLVAPTLEVQP